jgi:hypothetical protein
MLLGQLACAFAENGKVGDVIVQRKLNCSPLQYLKASGNPSLVSTEEEGRSNPSRSLDPCHRFHQSEAVSCSWFLGFFQKNVRIIRLSHIPDDVILASSICLANIEGVNARAALQRFILVQTTEAPPCTGRRKRGEPTWTLQSCCFNLCATWMLQVR